MLTTEVEARRKQCRMVNAVALPNGAGGITVSTMNCSGPECMAWRWTVHSKIENREARPVGFCGMVPFAPIKDDFGFGDEPINAAEVLEALPASDASKLVLP